MAEQETCFGRNAEAARQTLLFVVLHVFRRKLAMPFMDAVAEVKCCFFSRREVLRVQNSQNCRSMCFARHGYATCLQYFAWAPSTRSRRRAGCKAGNDGLADIHDPALRPRVGNIEKRVEVPCAKPPLLVRR